MAQTELLQGQYTRAVVQDVARHMLPRSAAWMLRDWLTDLKGAPLRGRGGWPYASPALSGASRTDALAVAPFPAGTQLVAIDNLGHVWKVDSASVATDKGAAAVPLQNPIFFNDKLIIPATTVYKYDGSAAPSSIATAPASDYGVAYKSRLVLARNRNVYFSDALDETLWDTANSLIEVTEPCTGIAALRSSMIVFGEDGSERIRGDVPPPGGDMVREPLFEEGCIDARSITTLGDRVIWANANGVHITDGAGLDNLIELGGMKGYWRDLLSGYTSDWRIAAGTFAGYYVVTVTNNSGFVDGLMCDVREKSWLLLNNLPASMFASRHNDAPEMFFALRTAARLGSISDFFDPASASSADANGTNVQPSFESAFYRGKPGSRRWKNLHFGVDLSASAGTYLEVAYTTDPNDQTYTVITEDDGTTPRKIEPTTGFDKVKLPLRVASDGIGLRVRLVGAADDVQLFDIEAEVHEREASR